MNGHGKYASTFITPIFGGRSAAEVEMSVLWEGRREGGADPWVNFNISEQGNLPVGCFLALCSCTGIHPRVSALQGCGQQYIAIGSVAM